MHDIAGFRVYKLCVQLYESHTLMAGFCDLHFDILSLITSEISIKDISHLQQCCHHLRDALDERALWSQVNRGILRLFSSMDHLNYQEETSEMLKHRALFLNRLRTQWTSLPRSLVPILSHSLLCSAELLPGGSHFSAVFMDGSLHLYKIGQTQPSFSVSQPSRNIISSSVVVTSPVSQGPITLCWLIRRTDVHELHIYMCDLQSETLARVATVSTQLIVQRFSVRGCRLAVVGYAIRSAHRSYVQIFHLPSDPGATVPQIASLSLDETVDEFGELLGVSLIDSENLLVCCRRGATVFLVSSPAHSGNQTEPVWSQDISDYYSHVSNCSIANPMHLMGPEGASLTACSIVTGDRFYLFGMVQKSGSTRYSVRPLDVLEPRSSTEADGMEIDEDEEFRDRSARCMRSYSTGLAVWLSPEREQLMTASTSPLSVFTEQQLLDVLGDTRASGSYGYDMLPHEIAVGGIDLPGGLDLRSVEQLSIDELSGCIGIFSKGIPGHFFVVQAHL